MHQSLAILILSIVSISVFIPSDCEANSSLEETEAARQLLFACQILHVMDIDDENSDARVVAFNLTNLCLDEYQTLNRMTARHNYDNSNERRMFTIEQNSKMLKIEASLPVVIVHRQEKQ